jgi:hypothetical protein
MTRCPQCPRARVDLPSCVGLSCPAYCGLAGRGEREWIDRILAWCAPRPEVVVTEGAPATEAELARARRAAKPRVPLGTKHPKPGGD